jgi:hypothetical protein
MRKIYLGVLFSVLCCLVSIGCAQKRMYYFGNYSNTLYSCEKNQDDESLLKHKQELETVITESGSRNLPVPPGVCAELGYINLKSNNSKEAIRLFLVEMQLYPESKHLMNRLIQNATSKNHPSPK